MLTANPCAGVWRPDASPPRERVLTDAEIRWFWRAAGELGQPFGAALKLLLLTGQRRSEVAGMRRSELYGDSWSLPASRTKNKRPHVVPLSKAARDLIASIQPIGTRYVFTIDGVSPLAGWSRIKARLDSKMAELARAEKATIAPG